MTAQITHATRGRVRVRVDGPHRRVGEAMRSLETHARRHPGINRVEIDARRGSALIEFDPKVAGLEEVLEVCRGAHEAFAALLPPAMVDFVDHAGSRLASRIRHALGAVDHRVLHATGGAVDLRMLVPIALGAVAVRQLARTGPSLPEIPWYVLAYYSFDTFVKLHAVQPAVAEDSAA